MRTAEDDVTAAVMQPFDAQSIGNTLNFLNTPITGIPSYFFQTFIHPVYSPFFFL
jgi:hypothetical protein